LKAVLLHNGNKFLSIWLAHAVHMTETYENLQVLLQKYAMKNTGGMYVLTWSSSSADWTARDSRARDCHHGIKIWSFRSETAVGQKNVAHPALGDK